MSKSANRDWVDAIARKTGVEPTEVQQILDSRGVHAAPIAASPRHLAIRSLRFSGVKIGTPDPGAFQFDWLGLGCGLWAMVTNRNLRGKSSVIEIVKWLLRGRPSDGLQADVRSWLQQCQLRFTLDDVAHEVRLESLNPVSGRLIRILSHDEVTLGDFDGESAFEAVMSDFFLREFALDTVSRWVGGAEEEGGKAVLHGWPSLSGAMFIGTNYSALLGDMPPESGMTTPLMQMYLGLPWVTTLTAATTAEQGAKRDQEARERRQVASEAGRKRRQDEIHAQLVRKRTERDATPSDEQVRAQIAAKQLELGSASREELEARERVERARDALRMAEDAHSADRQELQVHIDSAAAGAVFRALDPSCCPRCDTAITDDRRKLERDTHHCAVCGEATEDESDEESIRAGLEARVKASRLARDKERRELAEARAALEALQQRIGVLNQEISLLSARLSEFDSRRTLDVEVAILEGRMEEAAFDLESEPVDGAFAAVLKATVEEVKGRVKAVQEGILQEVSEEIVRYAKRFGMTNLTSAVLRGNTHLKLEKGGIRTRYGSCTAGEKLRLKVAAVLAMIRVAERRHVGRHPGLLMIDSPGAQEVAKEDLDQLIGGLEEVSKEFSHLQVFIAAMSSPAVLGHVPRERMRYAEGDAPLW